MQIPFMFVSAPSRESRFRLARAGFRGFTLIELLVVVAVIALVTSAVTPMVFSAMMANRITTAGETLAAQFSYAHQLAVSGNQEVEVRFYQYADASAPGSAPAYRALAIVRSSANYTNAAAGANVLGEQLGETLYMPSGVVISNSPVMSPPLTRLQAVNDRELLIKKFGAKEYRAFHFYADGSTDLLIQGLATRNSYFTVAEDKPSAQGDVPKNFFAVQVEPVTGRVITHRP